MSHAQSTTDGVPECERCFTKDIPKGLVTNLYKIEEIGALNKRGKKMQNLSRKVFPFMCNIANFGREKLGSVHRQRTQKIL